MNLKPLIAAGLIAWAVASCGNAEPNEKPQGHLVTETYIVQQGDNLNEISYKFMEKSSVCRDVREFRESIIEENWDTVFAGRYPHGIIYPGDRLEINYWKE